MLHILCSYAGVSVHDARTKYLPAFFKTPENKEWFLSVCGKFLDKKKIGLDRYLAQLFDGSIPCDEVGIMLVAMTFNIHFGIYHAKEYWCTNSDTDPWGWDGILVYAGKMRFIDTKVGEANRTECFRIAGISAPPEETSKEEVTESAEDTESPEVDDPTDLDYKPSASVKSASKNRKRTKTFTTLRPRPKPKRQRHKHSEESTLPLKKRPVCTISQPDNESDKSSENDAQNDGKSDKSTDPAVPKKSEKCTAVAGKSEQSTNPAVPEKSEKCTAVAGKSEQSTNPAVPEKSEKWLQWLANQNSPRAVPEKSEKSTGDDEESDKSTGVDGKSEQSTIDAEKSDKSNDPVVKKPNRNKSAKSNNTVPLRRSSRLREREQKNKPDVPNSPTHDVTEDQNVGENNENDIQSKDENGKLQNNGTDNDTDAEQNGQPMNNNDDNSANEDANSGVQDENDNEPQAAGSLNVTEHGIPKRPKKMRTFHCEDCAETFTLVKQLNAHYTAAHPQHVFQCTTCNKTYASRNAKIRHERTHSGMSFACSECSYTCLFKYELKNHKKKHTRTGLYPCLTRGCGKSFTTKKGMKQHMQVHQDLNLKCDVCGKDGFTTKGYLRQHKKGQHGDGFVSRCGAFTGKHPTARVIHQKECDDCIRILEERRKTADYYSSDSSSSSDDTSSGESVIPGSDSDSDWHFTFSQ